MNYTFQSFSFRGRSGMRPYYDLIANIAAEEFSHIELVAYTINLLLTGATRRVGDPVQTPLKGALDARNSFYFLATGQQALCGDSQGNFWTGQNVYSSGNLKLDLLHNFYLECGARANKIRVYEMVDDPVAREMVEFLLVRGGVHIVAYAKALERLSGVPVGKLLPIPDISNRVSTPRGQRAPPDPVSLQSRGLPGGERRQELSVWLASRVRHHWTPSGVRLRSRPRAQGG